MMKHNLASLEADFVDFKQNTENKINEFSTLLTNKDKEIELLKTEITNLTNYNNQKLVSDIVLKQMDMADELKSIQHKHRSYYKNF